jgi:hypothetical protein
MVYFCTRFEKQIKSGNNKEEHVPRHIELTAVLQKCRTNKIRVIESGDLDK